MVSATHALALPAGVSFAIASDDPQMLLSLEVEAHLGLQDETGQFPLHLAAAGGHLRCLEIILSLPSCDVNQYNRQGRTALHLASFRGHHAVAERLLCAEKIDVNQITQGNGCTAIYLACCVGRRRVVDALLRSGANFNKPTYTGSTPLAVAAFIGSVPVVQALLRAGADPHTMTGSGRTAIEIAAAQNHKDVVRCLSGDVEEMSSSPRPSAGNADRGAHLLDSGSPASAEIEKTLLNVNLGLTLGLPPRSDNRTKTTDYQIQKEHMLRGCLAAEEDCLAAQKLSDGSSVAERQVDSSTNSGSLHSAGALSDKS